MPVELPAEAERLLADLAIVESRIGRSRDRLDRRQTEIAETLAKEMKTMPATDRRAAYERGAVRLNELYRTTYRSELAQLAAHVVIDERRRTAILQKLDRFSELGEVPAPRGFDLRGTFDPQKTYARLDIVALDGGSFAARRDNPGPCPGDGWQLLVQRGKPGRDGRSHEVKKG